MSISYLVGDIRSGVADVSVHLPHDADVLVAVEQGVLLVAAGIAATAVDGAVGLQTGIGEDDDQTLGVLVIGGDGDMLLGDKLGEFGRRTRLGPWRVRVSHWRREGSTGGNATETFWRREEEEGGVRGEAGKNGREEYEGAWRRAYSRAFSCLGFGWDPWWQYYIELEGVAGMRN